VKVWALCIKKGCASVLTQPHRFYHYPDKVFQKKRENHHPEEERLRIDVDDYSLEKE